jgi:hypothetical protein
MIYQKRPRGRPPKPLQKLPNPKIFKNGLSWGLDALNNPEIDLRTKTAILAAVLRYEAARDFGPAATAASGKKEQRAEAAKLAASNAYAPPPSPPMPEMRLNA